MRSLQVRFIDLTLPQYWLPRYDWVMSLNVIEHIPEQFETIVLDNVARAAGEGIVMSWATTSQEGFQHVNRREPSHVNRVMAARKFYRDESAINKMREAATFAWFKVTIGVFRRTDVF